jgi:phosphate starvation-inducible membrane PsiE
MNPLLHFLKSCLTYKYEIVIGLLVFVLYWELVFLISKFLRELVGFELDKFLKWYLNKRK